MKTGGADRNYGRESDLPVPIFGHTSDMLGMSVHQPLRIFLSNGHDANEELVRRIKTDLEGGGRDVWFERSKIKFGDDWRRSIIDGILNSHRDCLVPLEILHPRPRRLPR